MSASIRSRGLEYDQGSGGLRAITAFFDLTEHLLKASFSTSSMCITICILLYLPNVAATPVIRVQSPLARN